MESEIETALGRMWVHDDFMKKLLVHPYEEEVAHYIIEICQPGMVVANIGANIGYFTRLMSECVGKTGVVHAVEPHPENVRLLTRNVRDNVVVYQCAAGMNDEKTRLYEHPENSGEHSLLPLAVSEGRCIEVVKVRMERLLPRLDFVLVDAQGYDVEVMVGLGDKRPPRAVVEYWEQGSDVLGLTREMSFDMYRRMGYDVELMHDDTNVLLTNSAHLALGRK